MIDAIKREMQEMVIMQSAPARFASALLLILVGCTASRAETNAPVTCYKGPSGSNWNGVCCNQPGVVKKTGKPEDDPFGNYTCETICKTAAKAFNSKSCKDEVPVFDDEKGNLDVVRNCKPGSVITWDMGKSLHVWADNWTGCGKGGADAGYSRGNGPVVVTTPGQPSR